MASSVLLTGYVLMAASPDLASFVPLLSGIPDDDNFGEENVPWRAEIGNPPTSGHRDLGAVK